MQSGSPQHWYGLGNARTDAGLHAEAAECFRRSIALDPAFAKAWNNLGAACERLGRHGEAEAAYKQAMALDASLLEPYLNLGRLCESRGELDAAAGFLRAGLERHPGDAMLAHLLAACTGAATARAPREHVVAYFDDFAPHFDEHLVGRLGYRVPQALAALLQPRLPRKARVMDLGCGTGLVGEALAGADIELHGIDLSPRMLERAAARGRYASLVQADADEGLAGERAASFDAVLAADVFIYLGELAGVFRQAARVLVPRGLFGFSVESLAAGDYALRPSGRYAHSLAYLRRLAAANGFAELALEPAALRRQQEGFAEGQLVLLERL